ARSPDPTEAFERLISPLPSAAFALACAMLRDRVAAEDAVQEAAIEAWRHLRKHDPAADPRAWFRPGPAGRRGDTRRPCPALPALAPGTPGRRGGAADQTTSFGTFPRGP